jgi:excinuclease ABC subunit A
LKEKVEFRYGEYTYKAEWKGATAFLLDTMSRREPEGEASGLESLISPVTCRACNGARLQPESLAVKINGRSIADYAAMSIIDALGAFAEVRLTPREDIIAGRILKEVRDRLNFLQSVGLGYLALDRTAASLSGGEGQRIRLATQIGSQLRGVLYVLDEPSIGLHPRDNEQLLGTLAQLRDLGNTVLVVGRLRGRPRPRRRHAWRRGRGHRDAGRHRARARVLHGSIYLRRPEDRNS